MTATLNPPATPADSGRTPKAPELYRLAFEELHELHELEVALHNASLFASEDLARPILASVLLTTGENAGPEQEPPSDGAMHVVGTDSYGLSLEEIRPVKVPAGMPDVLLSRADVVAIVKLLKPQRGGFRPAAVLELEIADADHGSTRGTFTFTVGNEVVGTSSVSGRLVEGAFPNYRQLLSRTSPAERSSIGDRKSYRAGVGGWQLLRLGKVKATGTEKRSDPINLAIEPAVDHLKPFTVRCIEKGSTFSALIMPVRIAD
jgi:hypothetical protein